MEIRRKSKQIAIGNVKIGGDAPISVQSMCNTDTRDVAKTLGFRENSENILEGEIPELLAGHCCKNK